MSEDRKRLIEVAFPLEQTSLDSVHEKSVRHGHISTLHIWPARRPLAACRAAVLATLLPAPDTPGECDDLVRRIGGKPRSVSSSRKEDGNTVRAEKKETTGSLTRWLGLPPKGGTAAQEYRKLLKERESELAFFRSEIRKAYGGRSPRVLDPFSGGGSIPLEAMRLGCDTMAMDINPVACFLLRAALEYPGKLAGRTFPLPAFALEDSAFLKDFLAAHPEAASSLQGNVTKPGRGVAQDLWGKPSVRAVPGTLPDHGASKPEIQADLPWLIRAWGRRVLASARKALAGMYPVYADFEPERPADGVRYDAREPQRVPLKDDGTADVAALNAEFDAGYLDNTAKPRWVPKTTVAYLWARTCRCSSCRAEVPLLKTRLLSKKGGRRYVLVATLKADRSGVTFAVAATKGGASGTRDEQGFMSRTGVTCPCCGSTMTMEDLRREGKAGHFGLVPLAVVYEQKTGKGYRSFTRDEIEVAESAASRLDAVYADIPFGVPDEPTPKGGNGASRAFSVCNYGLNRWRDLFTSRQLLALGVLVREVRAAMAECRSLGCPDELTRAIGAYLALAVDRVADYCSSLCVWHNGMDLISHTFARFALPMKWDFCEGNPISESSGNFGSAIDWVASYVEHGAVTEQSAGIAVLHQSCVQPLPDNLDCIITDPPYYDAIPYSDCMDFFHIWLRRMTAGTILDDGLFADALGPKWDNETKDGELIDDCARHGGNKEASKRAYEDGMAEVFKRCGAALAPDGRLVIVFANKSADAWETLVSAMIRAGFMVTASWPIATEMQNRMRAQGSAALSSSVWIVCRKRPPARPGWDNRVLQEMRENIGKRLDEFWKYGLRGPDVVWAAAGPALESYSRYPVVKKTDEAGRNLTVTEFLEVVRRMVVEFVVRRVIPPSRSGSADASLDALTSYYILHRFDFGMEPAPAGPCILYATACGTTDGALVASGVLRKGNAKAAGEAGDGASTGSGAEFRLCPWADRAARFREPPSSSSPLIDQVHFLMRLWKKGSQKEVNSYIDGNHLIRRDLVQRLIQALIEMADVKSEEKTILESVSNHIQSRGIVRPVNRSGSLLS